MTFDPYVHVCYNVLVKQAVEKCGNILSVVKTLILLDLLVFKSWARHEKQDTSWGGTRKNPLSCRAGVMWLQTGGGGVSAFQRWWSCTDHHGNHLTAVTQQPIKPFSIPRRVLTMFPESAAAVSHCSPPWICLQEVRRVRFPAFPSCYCRFVWF